MPIAPGTFSGSRSLDPRRNYRAYADIVLTDPAGVTRSSTIQCLVDTGSDYTVLPMSMATAVGIVPSGPLITFRTAAGVSYSLPSHPRVDLIIEGYAIRVPIAFSTAASFIPILGRIEAVAAFDIGFDVANWYWD